MDVITAEVLERLARRRRFSVRTLHAAQRLLIEQVPARVVATEFGLHLSRVYALRRAVLNAATVLAVHRPPLGDRATDSRSELPGAEALYPGARR